jgi:2-polyprenyl-3-methyl-5-hydroxy-6-metoxy-1,4-benzoquinol methylase
MPSIQDDRGFNQGFKPSRSLDIRTERRCDYMIGRMDLKKNVRILEIGCGTGQLSHMIAKKTGKKVLGTDICKPFIAEAKANYRLPNLEYGILDFNDPKSIAAVTKNHKFDYLVGNGILHHLYYNLESSLKNINKLLAKDGKIIFLEPNFFNPYCLLIFKVAPFRKLARLEPDENTFTRRRITKILSKTGFDKIGIEYRDFLVPGIPGFLVGPVISAGNILEKIPFLKMLAQSIYITAGKRS